MKKKITKDKPLSAKESLFISEYLHSLNAKEATKIAYPNNKNPEVYGCIMLKKPRIAVVVNKRLSKVLDKLELKAEDVIEEIRKLAFADIGNYLEYGPEGLTLKPSNEVDTSVISEVFVVETTTTVDKVTTKKVSTKFKLHDKLKSLEILARYFKLLTDSKEKDKSVTILDVLDYLKNKELERKQNEINKITEKARTN